MGSATSRRPPKRRNKSRRLPKVSGHIDPTAFGTQHSAYTVEGRIEAVGQLARGAKRAGRAQWRFVNGLFVALVGTLLVVLGVVWLISRFV